MTTDTDAARVTRWLVTSRLLPMDQVLQGYDAGDKDNAIRIRTYFDRYHPTHAPHRIVRVDMTLIESEGNHAEQ